MFVFVCLQRRRSWCDGVVTRSLKSTTLVGRRSSSDCLCIVVLWDAGFSTQLSCNHEPLNAVTRVRSRRGIARSGDTASRFDNTR